MTLIRILLNGLVMATEIVAIALVAWLGWRFPLMFAALTVGIALVMGLSLEHRRLSHELPFYFAEGGPARFRFTYLVGALEALLKSVLAGIAAVFTFSGTEPERLMWVAFVFAATVYAGSTTLRLLSLKFKAHPARWGYFRLAAPLGLLFSAGLVALVSYGAFSVPSISDMGWKIMWELPPSPSVEQVSELFFGLKQAFDDFIVTLLSSFMSQAWAKVLAVAISVNVLTGFVAALYSSVIANLVRGAEVRLF